MSYEHTKTRRSESNIDQAISEVSENWNSAPDRGIEINRRGSEAIVLDLMDDAEYELGYLDIDRESKSIFFYPSGIGLDKDQTEGILRIMQRINAFALR